MFGIAKVWQIRKIELNTELNALLEYLCNWCLFYYSVSSKMNFQLGYSMHAVISLVYATNTVSSCMHIIRYSRLYNSNHDIS